ncbi:universal stress protein [Agrobacterium sp. CCNWLW71]|uniref:universal stress protein n=1 Tax=unclassified Agrobacterium TaxID=2632611 RepID=UPI002FEFD30E
MTFATILNAARHDVTDEELNSSVCLAHELSAHLSLVLVATAELPPIGSELESVSIDWWRQRQAEQSKLQEHVKRIEALLPSKKIPFDVDAVYTEQLQIDNVIGHRAQFADLVVIGRDVLVDPDLRNAVLDGALFHAGVPVLLHPAHGTLSGAERVVVAWKDTPETAAAVRASMPFLKQARKVYLVLVDPPNDDREYAMELRDYLTRHGIDFWVDRLASDGLTVTETIEKYTASKEADLLVIGAYGHSRLRERIFGGVTKSIIDHPKQSVFLAR